MRSRVIGGAALGILAVGLWLGSYLKGPGLGEGTGTGASGEGQSGQNQSPTDPNSPVSVSTTPPSNSVSTAPARGLEVLPIHIRKDRYAVPAQGAALSPGVVPNFKAFVEIPLDEVVTLARSTPGNTYGTKVLLYISPLAVAENHEQLKQAFLEAGIDESSVKRETGFFD